MNCGTLSIAAARLGMVFGLASAYEFVELAAGEVVAQMIGGRLVNRQTSDLAKRRLKNMVEKMSIVSA